MSNSCCPPGSWQAPFDPSGPSAVKGTILGLGASQLPVYYSSPPDKSDRGIIVFTDVWGFSPRMKAICDTLALQGNYHVIMPDCFRGDTKANHESDFVDWLKTVPYETIVAQDIAACMDCLAQKGVTHFGSIGFCWGGWAIAKSASKGVPWKAGIGIHPSTKIESQVFGQDEQSMIEKVKMPLLLMPASNDADNLKPGGSHVKVLERRGGKSILFQDMVHGWVTRGDIGNERIRRDADTTLTHALDFFKAHLE